MMTDISKGETRPYDAMIGIGGIGSGLIFSLNGNHTLGREESRSGRFLKRNDYCKLHILAHYVQVLMETGFRAIPIGAVGDDLIGSNLLDEMKEVGLDLSHVRRLPGSPTLFCVCFVYPDGSGGNLTTDDSASAQVTSDDVSAAADLFEAYRNRGIALAVPEVSLEARIALLDEATNYGFFRASSFITQEMDEVRSRRLLERVDLLAVNLDEGIRLTGLDESSPPEAVIESFSVLVE